MRQLFHLMVMIAWGAIPQAHGQQAPSGASLRLSQHVHDVWTTDDGLPQSAVYSISQSHDGYLWLGTHEGLVRFDGVRFDVFDKQRVDAFRSDDITALLPGNDRSLWIGTRGGGVVRLRDGRFTSYTSSDGLGSDYVTALFEDRTGSLWVGTYGGGLTRLGGSAIAVYDSKAGLEGAVVTAVVEDAGGQLWVGTDVGVFRMAGESFSRAQGVPFGDAVVSTLFKDPSDRIWMALRDGRLYTSSGGRFEEVALPADGTFVKSIIAGADENLWMALDRAGVARLRNGEFEIFTPADGLTHADVAAVYEDREGSIWIGTLGGGLNRLRKGKFLTYTTQEGLTHDDVTTVYSAPDGSTWLGTSGGGVNRIRGDQVKSYTTADGLSSNEILAVHGAPDGSIWVGTEASGLDRLKNGRIEHYTVRNGLPSNAIYALHVEAGGMLWIGTDAGVSRFDGDRFYTFTTEDGLTSDLISALLVARDGTVWIGTYDGGLNRLTDDGIESVTTEQGLAADAVLALHEDGEGAIWVGTYDGGLSRIKGGDVTTVTSRDGLFNDTVAAILQDDEGRLWMTSLRGIFYIHLSGYNAFADGAAASVTSTVFETADGLESFEANGGQQPAAWKGVDGRLWFPTTRGVAAIDPSHVRINHLPPPVAIEAFSADGTSVSLEDAITLEPGSNKLSFEYTALSLLVPERVRFKYKLEGLDEDWFDAGSKREAQYTNLPPGSYTFRVIATNDDGIWNDVGASLSFVLKPHVYQTTWFRLLSVLLLLGLAYGGHGLRIRQLRTRERELEAVVEARTHDLRIEKENTERSKTLIEAQAEKLKALNYMLEEKVQEQLAVLLKEREAYEKRLLSEKERAEESDRLKSAILNNMNHEFRTPLTAILGCAEVLEIEIPEDAHEFVAPIKNAGRRLMKTLDALLHLSMLESKGVGTRQEETDVATIVHSIGDQFKEKAGARGLDFRLDLPTGVPLWAYLDPEGLQHVLGNLIDNAIRFTPEGRVCVRAARVDNVVSIEISDTGIGIEPAFQHRMFDAFTQWSEGLNRDYEGAGLGLTIVNRLVEEMGGRIDVRSIVGEGTTVRVLFRACRNAPAAVEA